MMAEYYDRLKESFRQVGRADWVEAREEVYSGWTMNALRAEYRERFIMRGLDPRAPPDWERSNLIEELVRMDLGGEFGGGGILPDGVVYELYMASLRRQMILSVVEVLVFVVLPVILKHTDEYLQENRFIEGTLRRYFKGDDDEDNDDPLEDDIDVDAWKRGFEKMARWPFQKGRKQDWVAAKEEVRRMLREYFERVAESFKQDEHADWVEALEEMYSGWTTDALDAEYTERFAMHGMNPHAPPDWERSNLIEELVKMDLGGGMDDVLDWEVERELSMMQLRREMILSVVEQLTFIELPDFLEKVDELTKGEGFFEGDEEDEDEDEGAG